MKHSKYKSICTIARLQQNDLTLKMVCRYGDLQGFCRTWERWDIVGVNRKLCSSSKFLDAVHNTSH